MVEYELTDKLEFIITQIVINRNNFALQLKRTYYSAIFSFLWD